MSVTDPIVMYVRVIPGFGWVAKLLEGWTNRLNKNGLIYLGLTDELFYVSAATSKAGVSIDEGRERSLSAEEDADRKGRVLKGSKFRT